MRAKPGLCSTYSSFTRSGPQTKTAYVFAASTTFVDLDSLLLRLVDVLRRRLDSHRQMVQKRTLGLVASPGWNST